MGNPIKAGTKSYHHDKPLGLLLRELNPQRDDEVSGWDFLFYFFTVTFAVNCIYAISNSKGFQIHKELMSQNFSKNKSYTSLIPKINTV